MALRPLSAQNWHKPLAQRYARRGATLLSDEVESATGTTPLCRLEEADLSQLGAGLEGGFKDSRENCPSSHVCPWLGIFLTKNKTALAQ